MYASSVHHVLVFTDMAGMPSSDSLDAFFASLSAHINYASSNSVLLLTHCTYSPSADICLYTSLAYML